MEQYVLTPDQVEAVNAASSAPDWMKVQGSVLPSAPRRVTFRVAEAFAGVDGATFEIAEKRTMCTVDFRAGEKYLVEVSFDPSTKNWSTACSRSRPIADAEADLTGLRAWKNGIATNPAIYGSLQDQTKPVWKPLANTTVVLRTDGGGQQSTTTDAYGHFRFIDLTKGA